MLEMLPPMSCVLFEPISESFHKGNYRVGIRLLHCKFHCSSSPLWLYKFYIDTIFHILFFGISTICVKLKPWIARVHCLENEKFNVI